MATDSTSGGAFGQPKPPRSPISRRQIETVVSRSSAIFGLAFAAQTVPIAIEQAGQMLPVWLIIVDASIFGGLLLAVVASAVKRWVPGVNGYLVFSWFIAMATWPFAVADPMSVADGRPWPWFLCTVATAAAAVAWPVWAAVVALVVLPLTYGIVRIMPSGGGAPVPLAALDVLYAIILGGTVLIIITLLRGAAASVDLAQSTALERYSNAVGQHATEVERVQVDAIVHDSVLTTLLSAARAYTPEAEALAARMASNAMGYLGDAAKSSPDGQANVTLPELAERIRVASLTMSTRFELRVGAIDDGAIPAQPAEAIYSATVQAMMNSVQHAGSGPNVARWLGMYSFAPGAIVVEVGDTGVGFEPHAVPTERMGLRVSIIELVSNAGGIVEVDSSLGEGTILSIAWPFHHYGRAEAVDARASVASETGEVIR